jgi:hypothetical protein
MVLMISWSITASIPVACRTRERMRSTIAAITVAPSADPRPNIIPIKKRRPKEMCNLSTEESSLTLSVNSSFVGGFLLGIRYKYSIEFTKLI